MRRPLMLQFCASTFLLLIAAGCGDVLVTKDNDRGVVSVTIVDSLARFDAVGRTHRFPG